MPLLTNVIVTTARASFNASTGVTTTESAYLTGVEMHLEPEKEMTWMAKSEGTLDSYYKGHVDTGVDIATGDTLISIKQLDGVTDYPGDGPATGSTNMVWKVVFHEEESAALIPE